ncbi:AI-2E family transporter, partial [Vibrio cholerae]|nr:AI-2E family transporter [Vibrio cholerae]
MSEKIKLASSHRVLVVALLASALACYWLVEPYINSIIMAFIISLLMFPIHD